MEKKRVADDLEPGPTPSPRPVDRFGFIKQEQTNSPEGITKSRSTHEREKYDFCVVFFPLFVDVFLLYQLIMQYAGYFHVLDANFTTGIDYYYFNFVCFSGYNFVPFVLLMIGESDC